MVRFSLDDVTDDMVLGQSLFSPSGELLLAAGHHVARRYRKRLKELGYSTLLIDEEGTEEAIPETVISEHLQREMEVSFNRSARELRSVFESRKMAEKTVRDIIKSNRNHIDKLIHNSGIARTLDRVIEDILSQNAVVLNLSALQKAGDELLPHVVNVTLTALCIGRKYHFSYEELKQLGMGAINYDLGMVAVSGDIRAKEGELTDDEVLQLQQHTVFGHLMLSQNPVIPPTSAAVALQHHEFQDGSGYPRGIRGDNRPPLKDFSRKGMIHRFSEIVAVADHYDMFTSGRPHFSRGMTAREAIRELIEMSGSKLNTGVVKTLVSIVPLYPVGARIRVVNGPLPQLVGYFGVVARDNPGDLEHPQIVLYETKTHSRIKPILLDLAHQKNFTIELV